MELDVALDMLFRMGVPHKSMKGLFWQAILEDLLLRLEKYGVHNERVLYHNLVVGPLDLPGV